MINHYKIGDKTIGAGHPCFIIAEAGTAHGGDIAKARALIDCARRAGADCVKFQAVFADEIVHPLCGEIELPGGKISIYQRFKNLEQEPAFYEVLKNETEKQGLVFLATPFGQKSALLLRELGVRAVKIASPELNHIPLLQSVKSFHVPVIVSTGVSTLTDIEEALAVLEDNVILLHCITSYPAPEEEYNLRLLPVLARRFGCPVGVSDHSSDPVLVPVGCVLMGGCVIEKHITLSKQDGGLDDPIALTEHEFTEMVQAVRRAEKNRESAEAELKTKYGLQRVERVFGTGEKAFAPCEAVNYSTTRRSILARKDIKKGEPFSDENVALLRSEKNLIPGLHPKYFSEVLGAKARRNIPSGRGIKLGDF